jgi:hypothetical protein
MRRGLVGHTGFVGSNLAAAGGYDAFFNSKNSADMAGQEFDELVCAGVPAVKWIANRDPEADRKVIGDLTRALEQTKVGRLVLISTIDVYPDPSQPLDEAFDPFRASNHAYGAHRLGLEQWVRARFANSCTVRLPALFGPGLKKNVIFDLMHDNQVGKIDPASAFQWYPVTRLAQDLERIEKAGLDLVNLFTEPLATGEIVSRFFPDAQVGPPSATPVRYDLRTAHAAVFGGRGGYALDGATVMAALGGYLDAERAA